VNETFHFGAASKPLFGVHHRPAQGTPPRHVGVVLCPPRGHEYIVAHMAFRRWARMLSEAGFHVLRFDYFGTGDSAGDCLEGHPERWCADIDRAIGELRLRSGVTELMLAGARLGAALTATAGATRGDIHRMMLWDPVVSGRAYLEELALRHHAMLRKANIDPDGAEPLDGSEEYLGFEMSQRCVSEIGEIDLLAIKTPPAEEVLLVGGSEKRPADPALAEHFATLGAQVAQRQVGTWDLWTWIEDAGRLVPRETLCAASDWAVETCR
jgi:uncharacterized protein